MNKIDIDVASHRGAFISLSFSSDSKYITVFSTDGELFLFSSVDGSLIYNKKIIPETLWANKGEDFLNKRLSGGVTFSPSGKYILATIQSPIHDDIGGFLIIDSVKGDVLFNGLGLLKEIDLEYSSEARMNELLRLKQKKLDFSLTTHRSFSDISLNFATDESLCVSINKNPVNGENIDNKFSRAEHVTDILSGEWNWRTRKLSIDTIILENYFLSDEFPTCDPRGSRIFHTYRYDQFSSSPYQQKTWFVNSKESVDISEHFSSNEGLRIYQFSEDGTKLAIAGNDLNILDLNNYEILYSFRGGFEQESIFVSKIFSELDLEIGTSANVKIDSRVFYIDKLLSNFINLLLEEFLPEERSVIEAKRQSLTAR